MPAVLAVCHALLAVFWLLVAVANLVLLRRTPHFDPPPEPPDPGPEPPLVSILVPARNEAGRLLERSVRSFLEQRWPNLEVIAVDDRSSDETGAILSRLAADHGRLRVISGAEPEPGWLGKPNALRQAAEAARGEWVLATDADVVLHPDAVGVAMAAGREAGVDAVTLIVSTDRPGWQVNAVLAVAGWMIMTVFPPLATNNPHDRRALGCGGFFLIRRAALEATGGYAAVARDLADDVGMAEALKRHGFTILCGFGGELTYTPMYLNLGELWQGFSKNAMRGAGHRLDRAFASVGLILLGGVVPVLLAAGAAVAWLAGADPVWGWTALAATAAWLAQAAAFVPVYHQFGVRRTYALIAPFGFAVMAGVLANAGWHAATGRSVDWRGRGVPQARTRDGGLPPEKKA